MPEIFQKVCDQHRSMEYFSKVLVESIFIPGSIAARIE
jgi:hypothetical protein